MEGPSPAAHAREYPSIGLPRRDRHDDQDDPLARAGAPRHPAEGRGAVRTLDHPDLHRRAALRWPDCAMGDRSSDEPRDLRHVCRDPARANLAQGRRGDPRQPLQPQKRKGRGHPQAARRLVPLPAALQSRPQSDRDGLRQAQGPPPPRRGQDHRCPVESHRRHLLLSTPNRNAGTSSSTQDMRPINRSML